jgi:hypothetical protein
MGHVIGRDKKLGAQGTGAKNKRGDKKLVQRKGRSASSETENEHISENKTTPGEKKDQAVELKGMSEYNRSF